MLRARDRTLLTTKLTPPRVPRVLVERTHLLGRLDAIRDHRLTLISASAGWGKTTLLSAWARRQHYPVVWLSLDELDDTFASFWHLVITAVQWCAPDVGQTALAMLQSPERASFSVVLTALLHDLALVPEATPIVLILDDYHVISDATIHEALTFVLDRLPPNMHVVVSSRADPPFPLSRWRVRGELLELRTADLRFCSNEAHVFFAQALGGALSIDDVCTVEQRTGGWAAGLHLAALALLQSADRSGVIRDFTGSHRYLADYIYEEVLAKQPQHIQHFLLHVSVLRRMNAALCDAVMCATGSQELLEALERNNLFIAPLDNSREWYRLHDVFRDALLARLRAHRPGVITTLHQRAAHWYAEQGEFREAITHALAAQDFDDAITLVKQVAPQLWLRGEAQTVHAWLHALPDDIFYQHADFVLDATLRLPESFRPADGVAFARVRQQVEQTIARVESALYSNQRAHASAHDLAILERRLRLLHALCDMQLLIRRNDVAGLDCLAKNMTALAEHEEVNWKVIGLSLTLWLVLTFQHHEPDLIPRLREAKLQAMAAREYGAALRIVVFLTHAYGCMGLLNEREHECRDGIELAQRLGAHTPKLASLYLNLAESCYARNQLGASNEALQAGMQIATTWQHHDLVLWGCKQRVYLALARKDHHAAFEALHVAEALLEQEQMAHWAATFVVARVRYWLAIGDPGRAENWLRTTAFSGITASNHELLFAQVHIHLAQKRYAEALALLESIRARVEQQGNVPATILFLVLYLVALHHTGEVERTHATLVQLLTLTEPETNVRAYLDTGEPMREALDYFYRSEYTHSIAHAPRYRAFVATLLALFEPNGSHSMLAIPVTSPSNLLQSPVARPQTEFLTRREQQVLRLLEAGATNAEIAQELVISLATAKKHVGNVLKKLGVARRAQAIARAQA